MHIHAKPTFQHTTIYSHFLTHSNSRVCHTNQTNARSSVFNCSLTLCRVTLLNNCSSAFQTLILCERIQSFKRNIVAAVCERQRRLDSALYSDADCATKLKERCVSDRSRTSHDTNYKLTNLKSALRIQFYTRMCAPSRKYASLVFAHRCKLIVE